MDTFDTVLPSVEELRHLSRAVSESSMLTELCVPDMHCGGCMFRIEKSLKALDGVERARVNLTEKRVSIEWKSTANPRKFVDELVKLGFHPVLPSVQNQHSDDQLRRYVRALAVAGFATGNVMLLSVSIWAGADETTRQLFHWISALITLPAIVYSGRFFFQSAWGALKACHTNMDVPISIGIALASALSLYDTIVDNHHAYFEAAIMLVFFLLIGRTIDHLMRTKAASAISDLQALEPTGAMCKQADGSSAFVSTKALRPGQRIVVSAGQRIPADGVVVNGVSAIDTELVDGESVPKTALPDQSVLAGTMNISAELEIEVSATAAESFLATIQQLVRYGEQQKGVYRQLADKASALYAPLVHSAAFITFLFWYINTSNAHHSLSVAISVLIITCPCALALAVPMVQATAANRLFRSGIVMKNGAALERIQGIDVAVLDKTGTLTDGLPIVANTSRYQRHTLALAKTLAVQSEHPYAKAIMRIPDVSPNGTDSVKTELFGKVTEIPGQGLESRSGDRVFRLGKPTWATDLHRCDDFDDDDRSATVLTENGLVVAQFNFEHRLRQDAHAAIKQLKTLLSDVVILSGDTPQQVNSVATGLGIDAAFARAQPGDKVEKITSCGKKRRGVLMVGDGINDAGAMAAATVSIAPGKAANVSRSVADFVFMGPSLLAVPETVSIARNAHKLIKQNFAIALVYNAVALPFAVAGYVTPLMAALAMSSSSILVVANALRVWRYPKASYSVPIQTIKERKKLESTNADSNQLNHKSAEIIA